MAKNWTKNYKIADLRFSVIGNGLENDDVLPIGFTPFECKDDREKAPLFTLEANQDLPKYSGLAVLNSFPFEDLTCTFGIGEQGYEFSMGSEAGTNPITLQMPFRGNVFRSNVQLASCNVSFIRFLLWMAYGVAAAPLSTLAVHSSVIVCGGKAVLFLGESGTGKSTHTRLWLKNVLGSKLLNDDSPIVRLIGGVPTCFGSPWSGKTNCYVNESYPIAAIVRLRQAPFNRIERLDKLSAFGALYPSCPPSFAFDERLTDSVCSTISAILKVVPVYMLDCLPNDAAAELAFYKLFND